MLYNDRGMKKWQGFVLAEHNNEINMSKFQQHIVPKREQLSEEQISQVLQDAFSHNKTVVIQLNSLDNGLHKENYTGIIKGFESGTLYINTHTGLKAIEIELIRHIESVVNQKWFE